MSAPGSRPSALVWLRRDLRLNDNPALAAVLAAGMTPIPVYIHAPEEEGDAAPGAASRSWLHQSLAALAAELRRRGSALVIRRGPVAAVLRGLLAESGAVQVHWTRRYEPSLIARDRSIKEDLGQGLARSHAGATLFEPWELRTQAGEPFRVFSPFWRRCQAQWRVPELWDCPQQLPPHATGGLDVEALDLRPRIPWDRGFYPWWQPGEAGAAERLESFVEEAAEAYGSDRNRPDRDGSSRLSPHLHFGEIAVARVVHRLLDGASPARRALMDPYVRELGWREFAQHLLYHFPHTVAEALNPQFRSFPWAADEETLLRAWRQGRTGVPIVDAGMRQLWHCGWMHNRVRMIVASFLCKNLLQHWQHGAAWFWDTLVDADLANNTLGWQWTAGCGADAAPYFRIFNPVSQGERFDPQGEYVRRWVPELAALPAERIQQPWSSGGVRGYPEPIVDLRSSREAALAAYARMRGGEAIGPSPTGC